jgi:hypothetical protein
MRCVLQIFSGLWSLFVPVEESPGIRLISRLRH